MSMRRRAVPKVDRHIAASKELETFFEILVPPGVSENDTHAFLQAHLGEPLALKVERKRWDEADNRVSW